MPKKEALFSNHQLEGSLDEVSFDALLDACRTNMVTGRLLVQVGSLSGEYELRAGVVDDAQFGSDRGSAAIDRARELKTGTFTLTQALPSLDGTIRGSHAEASLSEVSLAEVMRHCEDNALSCTISVTSGDDVGEVVYKLGEIEEVRWNDEVDEDYIVQITQLQAGTLRVIAPPLDLSIGGWPSAAEAESFSLVEEGARSDETRPAADAKADDVGRAGMTSGALLTTPARTSASKSAGEPSAAAVAQAPRGGSETPTGSVAKSKPSPQKAASSAGTVETEKAASSAGTVSETEKETRESKASTVIVKRSLAEEEETAETRKRAQDSRKTSSKKRKRSRKKKRKASSGARSEPIQKARATAQTGKEPAKSKGSGETREAQNKRRAPSRTKDEEPSRAREPAPGRKAKALPEEPAPSPRGPSWAIFVATIILAVVLGATYFALR